MTTHAIALTQQIILAKRTHSNPKRCTLTCSQGSSAKKNNLILYTPHAREITNRASSTELPALTCKLIRANATLPLDSKISGFIHLSGRFITIADSMTTPKTHLLLALVY